MLRGEAGPLADAVHAHEQLVEVQRRQGGLGHRTDQRLGRRWRAAGDEHREIVATTLVEDATTLVEDGATASELVTTRRSATSSSSPASWAVVVPVVMPSAEPGDEPDCPPGDRHLRRTGAGLDGEPRLVGAAARPAAAAAAPPCTEEAAPVGEASMSRRIVIGETSSSRSTLGRERSLTFDLAEDQLLPAGGQACGCSIGFSHDPPDPADCEGSKSTQRTAKNPRKGRD